MSYQFIVISISEERKKLIEEQFKYLKKECKVIYMEACIPSNSEEYLKDISKEDDKKKACCVKSHSKALEIASNDSSTDFSIILEDDVAFHKSQFLNVIEEFIEDWDTKVAPNKMVSLGWVPCSNYTSYLTRPSSGTLKSILGSRIFDCFKGVGLQCYMVRRKDLFKFIISSLNFRTYNEFKQIYLKALEKINNFGFDFKNQRIIAADYIINWILDHKIFFPPIAIEQDIKSNLGHNNGSVYWNNFFEGYEMIRDDYYL
jgi:hypothetical protein